MLGLRGRRFPGLNVGPGIGPRFSEVNVVELWTFTSIVVVGVASF